MKLITFFAGTWLVAVPLTGMLTAQHRHPVPPSQAATSALTAEAVQQLLDGEGMGLARPAEMNRYPGPKHVLELESELAISPQQEAAVERIRQQMLAAARPLGRAIVDAERALDEAFASGQMTETDLSTRLIAIAQLQSSLRQAHLRAHLLTRPVLTAEQVSRYYQLRAAHH
jgi:Spy/CpxP family protein refolding chaperone